MTKKTINAKLHHNPAPEYAAKMIKELLDSGMDHVAIAGRMGVSKRSVYRTVEVGASFERQFMLEHLTGRR